MLLIKDPYDLKKYLETRLTMARAQTPIGTAGEMLPRQSSHGQGMIYAFEESIKAVQAMIDHQHANKEER